MKKFFFLLFLAISVNLANAQIVRGFSNEFLNIGVGARALSMSKAVTSFTQGVEAGYWNPAGVITAQDYEFAAMHNSLFNGIGSYDYFGAALPIERDDLAMAVSVIRLGVDNILNTTNLIDNNGNVNFNNITSFSSADIAAILSIAKSFPKLNLNIGANAKIIRRNIGDFALGHGFGFDIGAQYDYNGIKIGAVIRDVTTTFTAWNVNSSAFDKIRNAQTIEENQNQDRPEKYELTLPKFQLGASYFKQLNEKYSLLTSVDIIGRFRETNDIVSSSFASFSPNLGFELGYKQRTFLRAGLGNIQKETNVDNTQTTVFEPNIGIGLKLKKVYIDYALTNVGAGSGINYSNVFSIKVLLNEMR
ncbi:putative type IX sorting system protein PorV2 [Wenyingzhuangia sp. IMCC45533]